MSADERAAPGPTVREATAADNDALIALERESPLRIGGVEETFDRSPDFFAGHRVQGDYRVVLGEIDGRVIGVMTGVIQTPLVQGRPRRLVYIRQARVHPRFHGRKVAWAMANELFAWAATRGAGGPYYLISPENEPSLAFVERGGGRWPVDATIVSFDVTEARGGDAEPLSEGRLAEAAALVTATHAGEDFFEPLTADSLAARLGRSPLYTIDRLYGVVEGGELVAVGGLWDFGATTERVHVDRATGETTRSRGAAVVDWGWAAGHEEAFAGLLRRLAAEARRLGRSSLMACEPSPGMLPDPSLPRHETAVALFTPALAPPPAEAVRGLFVDLLCV